MGRKSKIPALMKHLRQTTISRRRKALKQGPWDCPWCHAHALFAEKRYNSRLVLFACGACHLGEMLPRPPHLQIVDLYNMLSDSYMQGHTPVFKYKKLTRKQHAYLVRRMSFGQIEVERWVEDERFEE